MTGRIVVLNGAPRAGKSSIARAIQDGVAGSWINLGVDTLMAATPEALRPGIGLRPGGERPDLEPMVAALYASLFDSMAAFSRQGIDVVSDLGIHDDYSRPLGIWEMLQRTLSGLPLLTVGVLCSLEVVMARRNADPRGGFYASGEGVPEPVARWQVAVHAGKSYDLTVDAGRLAQEQSAAEVARELQRRMGAARM